MPHDNDLNEGIPADLRVSTGVWDTGIDPGRDGVVGTGDDVDLQQELAAMQRDGIQILHVYYHGDPATLAYWQQWARITGGEATLSTSGVLSETIVRLVREAATRPLPACPFGTARSSDNICQPVRAVVFVSGLGSSQKFADSNTLASCPDAGTWQHVAQQIRARHGKNYQVFLAPVDRASGSSGNCPGVRRAAEPVMRIQSMKDTNIDDNGRALSVFLGNLKARYGVTDVVIVGHSFGGLWARSALTRQSKGAQVRILDIITVGTPHEGSYAADVREKVRDICTNFGDKRMRAVACTADGLIAAGFGKTSSLTGSYVSGWNRSQSRQTPWGCVPVRGIAGKAFTWPLPTTTSYMSPHDGVVGIGSALPSEAAVPGFQSLGSYEHLVHTAAFLASLSGGESMTKAPVVTEAISDLLPSGPELLLGSCSTKQTTFSRGEHRTNATDGGVRVDQAKKKPAKPKVRRVAVAFSVTWKKGAGNALTAKRAETNAYVLTGKSSLRCGKLRVDGVPLFGVSEVRYVPAAACKGKIRVVGATKKTGAIPVAKSKGKLTLVATSKGVAIRASGIPGGKVQVSFSRRGAKTLRKWVAAGRTTAVRLPKGRYDVTAVAVRPKARYSVRTSWTRNSAG